jgi:hypothetical protein
MPAAGPQATPACSWVNFAVFGTRMASGGMRAVIGTSEVGAPGPPARPRRPGTCTHRREPTPTRRRDGDRRHRRVAHEAARALTTGGVARRRDNRRMWGLGWWRWRVAGRRTGQRGSPHRGPTRRARSALGPHEPRRRAVRRLEGSTLGAELSGGAAALRDAIQDRGVARGQQRIEGGGVTVLEGRLLAAEAHSLHGEEHELVDVSAAPLPRPRSARPSRRPREPRRASGRCAGPSRSVGLAAHGSVFVFSAPEQPAESRGFSRRPPNFASRMVGGGHIPCV